MRGALLIITLAACSTKTVESEIKAHKPRLQAVLDTFDVAVVRTDDQKAADMVDIDALDRGAPVPALPDELRRTRPLQILAMRSRPDEESPVGLCQKLLTTLGFDDGTKAAAMSVDEVSASLKACEARYIEVIERDDSAGRVDYGQTSGATVGPAIDRLSKGGTFEIFDTTDKKRIVSVKFLVHESPPATMDAGQDLDRERLYRAADEAFKRLLAVSVKQ